ncbi:MAG: polymer-forming cytoskeletal protein [Deltaproteobacteria bacterium]|nr:MAG: polymer-forming cytoskeletal protein [Deltaproteobacteria bacterium]
MKKSQTPEKGDIRAFLGPGSSFEGKLVFDEIVRIDGRFKGEIVSRDTLIVGSDADIEAEIEVGTLVLSGRYKGNVRAATKVDLRAPAQVEGHITTPVLVVEEGVLLNAQLQMGDTVAAKSTGEK